MRSRRSPMVKDRPTLLVVEDGLEVWTGFLREPSCRLFLEKRGYPKATGWSSGMVYHGPAYYFPTEERDTVTGLSIYRVCVPVKA